jgi:hypothetical protein
VIRIEDLKEEHKGRSVTYKEGTVITDFGHITSWNQRFIFVDYGHSCGRGIATDPKDLTWG